jgi:hypothetical protein
MVGDGEVIMMAKEFMPIDDVTIVRLFRRDGSEIGIGESVMGIAERHRDDLRGANLQSAYLGGRESRGR